MRHRNTRFLLPCLLLVAWFLVQAQQEGRVTGQSSPEFRVLEVRGTAYVARPGVQGFQQVSLSTREFSISAHDEVQTGLDGYVRIGLQDGSQLEILANSRRGRAGPGTRAYPAEGWSPSG